MSLIERDGGQLPLYDFGGVHPSHLVRPEYPQEEKERKLFGEAIIRVLVTADGRIAELEIRRSIPSAAIGASAMKAVSQWHFPQIADSSYFVDVPVIFAPEGTPIL